MSGSSSETIILEIPMSKMLYEDLKSIAVCECRSLEKQAEYFLGKSATDYLKGESDAPLIDYFYEGADGENGLDENG